ncbi:FAD-dependent oxidoreductase [Arthrobacter sp. M4]|uniref:FAD-dependent oxidoreductase n=1 Tax=Arthrobacter sp. M4 TaxID=218160 RepID=UPI001CDC09A6|nr:FAD-dependent oxidoreductase [Arthrobacter sp. M4]MCA4135582.1 FAD-dependent oxidoreductase [Arthrobacter sp. M4]
MTSLWLDRRRTAGTTATVRDSFIPEEDVDAVVIGAGLTGLVTALLLVRSGMRVTVLEGRTIGGGNTGLTTAKLSILQGTVLSGLRKFYSAHVVAAHVEGNKEGQAWLLRYLDEHGTPYQVRDAFTYATTDDGVRQLEAELKAAKEAGLGVLTTRETGLPFSVRNAILLPRQAQFDPMDVLETLAADIRGRGGRIVEHCRVHDVETPGRAKVVTDAGSMNAETVVLATGHPILNRGLYFTKLLAHRSYAVAMNVPDPSTLPQGMYLSAESPVRSVRTTPGDNGEILMVGGNGHPTGRFPSPKQRVDELIAWGREHFSGAEPMLAWGAQDYKSVSLMPIFGLLPRGAGRIYVATGYNKWGMTNAVVAALGISSQILGGGPAWAKTLHHRVTHPAGVTSFAGLNLGAARAVADGRSRVAKAPHDGVPAPAEGTGIITRDGTPTAVSTVDGQTCKLSAVCTHLGGILTWNDADKSWDCPLHGSRFSPTGEVLDGPANRNLRRLD